MTEKQKDEFDATRDVVDALRPFSPEEQKRIIKWAGETLGLAQVTDFMPASPTESEIIGGFSKETVETQQRKTPDIKTFVQGKNPRSDRHFASVVAYYYQFESQERKDSITKDDLVEATRLADWERLPRPDQTLVNAANAGLLDNVSRGHYSLNSVGENLVAMLLPSATQGATSMSPKKLTKKKKKK